MLANKSIDLMHDEPNLINEIRLCLKVIEHKIVEKVKHDRL